MRHAENPSLAVVPTLLLAAMLALPGAARADATSNLDASGLAIQGYDPVAYFVDGKPVHGDPEIPAMFDGARYLFTDQRHRQMFLENPTAYVPQYGGWCAYGLGVDSTDSKFSPKKYPIDPTRFEIVDGKLYLFYFRDDFDARTAWMADREGVRRRADAVWKQLVGSPPPAGASPDADRERIALDYLEALRRLDWDKQRSFYTESSLFEDPTAEFLGSPWSVRGGDAIVKFFRDGAKTSATLWTDHVIHHLFVAGPWVIVELDTTIRSTGAPIGFPNREMEMTMPRVIALRIVDGKVLERRDYTDFASSTRQALQARARFQAAAGQ